MSKQQPKQLRLGAFLTAAGSNVAAWRHQATPSDAPVNLTHMQKLAQIAESGKFDFLFIADSAYITKDSTPYFLSRFDPMAILSALSVTTKHIGLVGTFTTSFSEPFTTARQLASLDKLSNGRAGWNAVTSALEGLGRNHSHDKLMDHALRYRMAEEYIELAKGLWDSWEDDAFVRNKETGQYVDFNKMHTLNHVGEFYKVEGPLNMEPSIQGRPVIFQAGGSEEGKWLAAKHADAIFSRHSDVELAAQFAKDIRSKLSTLGRSSESLRIFPTITPIVGGTEEEAKRRYEATSAYVDINLALKYLSRYFSFHDFTQYPLDEPLPEGLEHIGKNSFKSTSELYLKIAREEQLTLSQLALRVANPKGDFVGTPEQIADRIQARFETGDIAGYIISGHVQPEGLQDFVEQVVPILQRRGLFRSEYESDTLRGHLGLEYPTNRYVTAKV